MKKLAVLFVLSVMCIAPSEHVAAVTSGWTAPSTPVLARGWGCRPICIEEAPRSEAHPSG